MNACFVGVDVGLSGAIAAIIEGQPMPCLWDMPTRMVTRGEKNRRVLDTTKIRSLFAKLQAQFDLCVMIERPQMRPAVWPGDRPHKCSNCGKDHLFVQQGLVSQAMFLGQYERIAGQLEGLGIPFDDIHPATWKKDVFHGRSEKVDSRMLAGQLYPTVADKLTLKKNDGLAEALLLADYVKRRRYAPF